MRPVDKGPSPYTSISSYAEALPYLEKKIGCYCSYCEMSINHAPEVEHVFAKSKGGSTTAWDNLLLGCKYCNTRKGTIIGRELRDVWVWPDTDNTALAFLYDGGVIQINEAYLNSISVETYNKVKRVFDDLKLDNVPKSPKDKDRRYNSRINAHGIAKEYLESWIRAKGSGLENYKDDTKNSIKKQAISTGFFSIWMAVFNEEIEIKLMLIDSFNGTAKNCFDINCNPIPRVCGEI